MRIRKLSICFFLALICSHLPYSISGQNIYTGRQNFGRPAFNVDYSQFKSDQPGLNLLELYYKIFNNSLQFVRDGNRFRADYEIAFTIYEDGKKQVTAFSKDKSFYVSSYESTISPGDFRISQFNQLLPPGKYKIECHLIDNNSGSDYEGEIKVELTAFDNRNPQISGIEFVHSVDTSLVDSVFRKGNLSVIPLVSREFSGDSAARLSYYQEIYQGSSQRKDVMIVTSILDRKLNPVYKDSIKSGFNEDDPVIRQVRQISLSSVKSGDYTLEIVLRGRRNRVVDRIREPFVLYWTPEAMVLHDYEMTIMQLKYIAEPEDVKKLKEAEEPEERIALWREFWLSHDPTPTTPENEAMDTYYGRIRFANRNFGAVRKDGWRTDRGMIFIQYGEPDQIEDYPFELNTKAYQIWYYYHPVASYHEPSVEPRKFVFVDEWNDGDFRLQYPYDGRRW